MSELTWYTEKKDAFLKDGDKIIITIRNYSKNKNTTLEFNGRSFQLVRKGFLHPALILKEGEEIIATQISSVWGRKAEVKFSNAAVYNVKIQNNLSPKITYGLSTGDGFLTYSMKSGLFRSEILFDVRTGLCPDFDLNCLIALGYYTFQALIRENNAALTGAAVATFTAVISSE